MNEPTVWVTGAGGLIGNQLVTLAAKHSQGWRVRSLTRHELELTDSRAVEARFQSERPSAIVHCAGLTRSVACQQDPALARTLNVEVTRRLTQLAADGPFVFLSSDLVFDGRQGNYVEGDPVNPLSVYGETKAEAETLVLANPRHTVIRTSLNGGVSPSGDRSFSEELRRAWGRGDVPTLFTDEFRSPIPATATAQAVWELVGSAAAGLYHVAGSERLSRWQIGLLVAQRWPQLNPRIRAGSLHTYRGAPRAPDTSLNCAKAQARLSFPLPGLTDWLAAHPEVSF